MNISDVKFNENQLSDERNERHINAKQHGREPQLREINFNIANGQSYEDYRNKMPQDLKSKIQAANKSLDSLHETENHVDRLLEKLQQERKKILEFRPNETDQENVVRSKANQENHEPDSAPLTFSQSQEEFLEDREGIITKEVQSNLPDSTDSSVDEEKVIGCNIPTHENIRTEEINETSELLAVIQCNKEVYHQNQAQNTNEANQPEELDSPTTSGTTLIENEKSVSTCNEINQDCNKENDTISFEDSVHTFATEQGEMPSQSYEETEPSCSEQIIETTETMSEDKQELIPSTQQEEEQNVKNEDDELRIIDLLYVSKTNINYGVTLPGQILEESFEIVNRSQVDIVVQIFVECINQEFAESDEYVFAIRRSQSTDYNDKHYLLMSPFSSATFKLAVKVPNTKMKDPIRGETIFMIKGLDDRITLHMETESVIPKIVSPKELYHSGLKCKVIKFAVKNYKKLEAKLPIKNLSKLSLTLDLEIFQSKESEDQEYLDCICAPQTITISPNAMSIVNLVLVPKLPDSMMSEDIEGSLGIEKNLFKKILVAKCRDSSIIYSFVILVEVLA